MYSLNVVVSVVVIPSLVLVNCYHISGNYYVITSVCWLWYGGPSRSKSGFPLSFPIPLISGRCIKYTTYRQATPISSWEATSPDGWSWLGRRWGWRVALRPERLYLWVDSRLIYTAPRGSSLHFGIGKDGVLRGVSQPVCSWARKRTVGEFKEKLSWNFTSTEGEEINSPMNCTTG